MTRCINTFPGYMCTACPQGYTGHVPHGIGLTHALGIKQVYCRYQLSTYIHYYTRVDMHVYSVDTRLIGYARTS